MTITEKNQAKVEALNEFRARLDPKAQHYSGEHLIEELDKEIERLSGTRNDSFQRKYY